MAKKTTSITSSNSILDALRAKSASNFEKLKQEAEKAVNSQFEQNDDERFWVPTVDKSGNGYAVIRFLPSVQEEDVPFVRLWDHGFQGPGGWYIEKSLTTLGLPDPVSEYNSELWNSTKDDDAPARKQARNQKRRLYFISNILVVEDSANPENNGKVKLYRYGKKIFDKLSDIMNPKFPDEAPIDPFNLWTGANLKLKIRTVDKFRNYDRSEFSVSSAVADSDELIAEIYSQVYPLQPFLDKDKFKTYDELKLRLQKILNNTKREPELNSPKQKTRELPETLDNADDDTTFDSTLPDDEANMNEFFNSLIEK